MSSIHSIKSSNVSSPSVMPGFGEHSNPTTYKNYSTAKKIAYVALAIFTVGVITGALIAIHPFLITAIILVPLSLGAIFAIGASTFSATSLLALASVIHYKNIKNAFLGVTNSINKQIVNPPVGLGDFSPCQALPCSDNKEAFEWKKRLIESAKENIVLSGNYCGGDSFNEVLDLIEKQIKKKPHLKVVILSSEKFLDESNQLKLDQLVKDHLLNFQFIQTSEIWHLNPGVKKTTNHSKFLVIDYGSHFLLGGSGIEDKYSYHTGLETEEQFGPKEKGLLNFILPNQFRDEDYVFSSSDQKGVGRRVYIEALKLAIRWMGINDSDDLSLKGIDQVEGKKLHDVASQLLLDETQQPVTPRPFHSIEAFDKDSRLVKDAKIKIICIGPEHIQNPFEEEIFKQITQAKKRIFIDHLYFHPTKRILEALAQAANRGVKITILTNGNKKKSPITHAFFVSRNRYNYYLLAGKIKEGMRTNLDIREFVVPQSTLHKKLIVVDNYVIAGSSNLGYKSLVTMSDHEINFVIESQKFADQVLKIGSIDANKGHAVKISNPKKFRMDRAFKAGLQRAVAPLIG